jgi:chemotaxis signal transduction protein
MSMDTDQVQLVVFRHGDAEYALPITDVQEVILYQRPRETGDGGVINVRGKLVAVVDLADRLGTTAGGGNETAKIVIVETGGGQIGLVVDTVDEVTAVEREQLERPPIGDTTLIDSIAKLGDRLVVVLAASGLAGSVTAR